jgi:hypothetical protein
MTAERLRRGGLLLHTCTVGDVRVIEPFGGRGVEDQLRERRVRIVDCWGAIIAPTIDDFAEALAQTSERMRQSSDSA